MGNISRREFAKRAFIGAAAGTVLPARGVLGANDDIRIGVIGIRSMGWWNAKSFNNIKGCRVVALCDVDPEILRKRVEEFKKSGVTVNSYTDAGKMIESSDIDAVCIATPNHWHGLLTVWACRAGKDVYVEKPVSHSIEEGRAMVAAAEKYNRIVQAGIQNRSCTGLGPAVSYIQQGNLGKIQYIHALWYRQLDGIGSVSPWRPDWMDYDMYCGPSENVPLRRNSVHYDWHWMWRTGNGDLGNLGVHVVDVARWFMDSKSLPRRVMSLGGRYLWQDAGQTPNTQLTLLEFGRVPVLMENRTLPVRAGVRQMDAYRRLRAGVVVQCDKGFFAGDRGGGWVYDKGGKRVKQFPGDGGGSHQQNFIDAVRSRKRSDLRADISVGHLSTAACLLGNVSYRLGWKAAIGKIREQISGHAQAPETLERIAKHLAANRVDLSANPLTLGPWLDIDIEKETIKAVDGSKDKDMLQKAGELSKSKYRKPYLMGKFG